MIRKWFFAWMGMTLFAAGAQAAHFGEVVSTSDSQAFFVDSRIVSYRTLGPNDRSVNITYSGYNWDTTGSAGKTATVTLDDEETLKSATGEGVVVWRPKTAETHTFKHACNGATQIATFIVEGPVVTIERVKTGTNANTFYCKINCEPSDAVIHYTTDGSRPTTASAVYTGPFIVDPIRGSIVQAMAVVETGLESRPVAVNFAPLGLEEVASASSATFRVDGRVGTGEPLPSAGDEILSYSTRWENATAVTVKQGGQTLVANKTGEGALDWSAQHDGTYELSHISYTGSLAGKVETATFVVTGKAVPVGELTIDWSETSFVYDGQPKEPVITVKDGATTLTKGTHYLVEYKDNVNVGTAKAIVKGIEPYVGEVTNTFAITKSDVPGGGEEPGTGTVPEGGLSKFDATYMYDGEGHTIKTNELVAAFRAAMGGEISCMYARGQDGDAEVAPATGWSAVAPTLKDVGSMVVWYKVTNPNYNDFVYAAKVTVTKRAMSAVSVSNPGVIDYTGAAITPSISVSDGSPSIVKASDYMISYADNVQPGTARIILTATAGGNYTGTKIVPFTIRKTTFDIDDGTGGEGGKASSFSYAGVYDGLGHGIDVQIANPPAGTTIRYSRGSLGTIPMSGWSTVNPLFTNVCDKVVVWYAVECAGYISYTNNATVTITSKPIAVSADAKEKVFGTSDPALTYVASGLLGMDTLTGALTRTPGEAVGTYAILKGTLAAGLNYALDFTGATFTISQTPIIGPFEPAEPDIDPETGLVVIRILGDQGPIEIPDNLGPFILDLNGHSITGVCGSAEVGTYDGGPALTIVHVDGGEGTGLIIRNSDPEGRGGIFGGDGANGTPAHPAGGNGGPGILIEDAAVAPSVTVEENVLVRGGRGGDGYAGSGADGGNGGAGIEDRTTEPDDSTIVNGGTIEGGDGGNGADGTGDTPGGNGGNGGAGVDGDVDVNTGTITGGDGGDGGDSESGNGGNGGDGGDGVSGDVGSNEGTITGGDGGNGGDSESGNGGNGGDGGDGVGGDVADNTGTITGGNGGNGGDSESGNGGNGGDGGDGVGGDVGSNEGTITGGNGGNGGDSESGNGGNGGDGGNGVGGDVGDNMGTITDGEDGTTVLTETMVSLAEGPWIYVGTPVKPTVTVTSGGSALVEGVDFEVVYLHNINAETATAVITGLGSCEGMVTKAFAILPRAVTVKSASKSKTYDGMPLKLTAGDISVSSGGGQGLPALPAGESFVYGNFAERTEAGQTSAMFTIAAGADTKLTNYAITPVYGTLTVTKGTIPGGGEEPGTGEIPEGGLSKFDAVRVYNGKGQTIDVEKLTEAFAEVVGDDFTVSFAVCESGGLGQPALPAWTTVAPTLKDVGSMVVWYKVTNPNFEDFVHTAEVKVVPKKLTDEMVQLGEDAFFFDGDAKKPTVDVIHEVDGQDVCTTNDYTLVYGEKADAGWWVTVTGKGNYSGTVTKIVPVLKRPVTPPVVTPKAYNGKTQKPTIPTDSRWTVVANPGGINVGEYTNVVLRLTNTTDYKWKGGTEDETDVTLVFAVTKANNGWSRYPAMAGWEYGQTPSEPNLGQARYGTVQIAYRKAGADVSTETAARPVLPGLYIARFYVEATDNFIGVTRDVAFEIAGTAPDDPVDPPPELPDEVTALISMGADGTPVIGWMPDLSDDPRIVYTVLGKAKLSDAEWTPVTDANKPQMRFFKVRVEVAK